MLVAIVYIIVTLLMVKVLLKKKVSKSVLFYFTLNSILVPLRSPLISISCSESTSVQFKHAHNKLFKRDSQRVAFSLCVGFGV